MPAGLVPLQTAAKYGNDQIARGIVETIITGSPLLEQLTWVTFAGNALEKRVEATLPTVGFRAVNASYTKSHGSNDKTFWGVSILGGEYGIDNFEVDVVDTVQDLEADQINKLGKANRMRFDYEFFQGTGLDDGFRGVNSLIADGHGQLHAPAAAGVSLDELDIAIDLFRNTGKPHCMLVNRTQRRRITNRARTSVTGVSLIDVGTDVFGRKVNMYDDIPMRITEDGMDSTGAIVPVQPFTEPSSTSSLYLLKFSKDDVTGLMGKGGSFTVRRFSELESAPQRMGRLEWYPGLAVFDKYSIVRYSNITAA